jgi:hypothetical protein
MGIPLPPQVRLWNGEHKQLFDALSEKERICSLARDRLYQKAKNLRGGVKHPDCSCELAAVEQLRRETDAIREKITWLDKFTFSEPLTP